MKRNLLEQALDRVVANATPSTNEERADWLLKEEERFLNEPAEEITDEMVEDMDKIMEDDSPIDL